MLYTSFLSGFVALARNSRTILNRIMRTGVLVLFLVSVGRNGLIPTESYLEVLQRSVLG